MKRAYSEGSEEAERHAAAYRLTQWELQAVRLALQDCPWWRLIRLVQLLAARHRLRRSLRKQYQRMLTGAKADGA